MCGVTTYVLHKPKRITPNVPEAHKLRTYNLELRTLLTDYRNPATILQLPARHDDLFPGLDTF